MELNIVKNLVLTVDRTIGDSADFFNVVSTSGSLLRRYTKLPQPEDLLQLSKDVQGVFWGGDEDICMIITDRFGSIPVYVYETLSRFVFSTSLASLFEYVEDALHIDLPAMWESILLDMPLAPRTLFREIRQLDPGTLYQVDFKTRTLSQHRYYNFTFPQISLQSLDRAIDDLVEALFATLKTVSYSSVLLPLSGGIDSRLLAALLCKVMSPNDITTVTFAFGPQSMEWYLAQQVCDKLGITNSVFHRLTPDSYTAVLPDFVEKFGGTVSAFHAHLYSFLISKSTSLPAGLVSGFFADAAAGYGSAPAQRTNGTFKDVSYYKIIEYWNKEFAIPDISEIDEDFQSIFNAWKSGSSITSFREYVYVSQRQQQLLFPMATLYREHLLVEMPYAIPAVAEILLGMPYEIRCVKGGIRMATEKIAPNLASLMDISSRPKRITWQEKVYSWPFRFWHRFTIAMAMMTHDLINLPDFEKTEAHARILRTQHRGLLLSSVSYLQQVGLLNPKQASVFSVRSYDDVHFPAPQYRLITLAYLIKHLTSRNLLSI